MSTDTEITETIRISAVDSGYRKFYYGVYYSEGDERNVAGACNARTRTREDAEFEALGKVLEGITRQGNESWFITATKYVIQTSCSVLSQWLVVDLPEYRSLGDEASFDPQVQRASKMLDAFSAPMTFLLVPNSHTAPARKLAEDFSLSNGHAPRTPAVASSNLKPRPPPRAKEPPTASSSAAVELSLLQNSVQLAPSTVAQATESILSLPSVDHYIPTAWLLRWEKDPVAQSRIPLPRAGQLKNIAQLCEKVVEMTVESLERISWPIKPDIPWDKVLDALIKVVDAHRPLTHRGGARESELETKDGEAPCHSGVKRQAEDAIDSNAKRQKSESGCISTAKPSDGEVLLLGFLPVLNALLDRISSGAWGGKQPIVNVVYLKGSIDDDDRRLYACIPKVVAKVNSLVNKINGRTESRSKKSLIQAGRSVAPLLPRIAMIVLEQPDAREKLFGNREFVGHRDAVFAVRSVTGGHGDLDELSLKEIPRTQPQPSLLKMLHRKLRHKRFEEANAQAALEAGPSVERCESRSVDDGSATMPPGFGSFVLAHYGSTSVDDRRDRKMDTISLAAGSNSGGRYFFGVYYGMNDERNIAGACAEEIKSRGDAELETIINVLESLIYTQTRRKSLTKDLDYSCTIKASSCELARLLISVRSIFHRLVL
ncbi:hypothetical protein CYLTODRAFT_83862 [Cylindrobasidium torrendii FP15055 ss-10]|uniref:Uncharacterized protein n=1 Tax=Cylindrobasidium torrendii FP15055 ss-10 TaxID=1314674 RepID=A0A0D7B2K4_9AGAR|nr:hypothetical protein CYLTODRAFT_83862 [Cylindrobasidium torrendii FP15055 ss-10]